MVVFDKEAQYVLKHHKGSVLKCKFNSTGSHCLSAGKDRLICLWNPHKGLLIKEFKEHNYEVRDVAIYKDNSKFVSCGGDRALLLWDVLKGNVVRKFWGQVGVTNAVCLEASDQILFSGGADACVRVWDLRSNSREPIQILGGFKDNITSICSSNEIDSEVIASSVDGAVHRFDIRQGLHQTHTLNFPVTSVTLSSDTLCMLAQVLKSQLILIDKKNNQILKRYRGNIHESVQMDSCFSFDDQYVIGGSEDGQVYVWDLVSGDISQKIQAHNGTICSISSHPRELSILTCGVDGTIKYYIS